ncbi:MAG: hypothetical protein U0Q16_28660 [Bryobacteraceae bacterium]
MEQFALAILVGIGVVFGYLVALRSNRTRTISPGQASLDAERFMVQDLQLQEEVIRLKDDIAMLRVTKSTMEGELAETKKRSDDSAAEREMRMAVLRGETEQLRREREHLKTEHARLETENQSQSGRIGELIRDLTDSHAESARLRGLVTEAEAKLEEGRRVIREEIRELLGERPAPQVDPNLRMEYELAQEEVSRLRALLAESDLERERLTAFTAKLEEERDTSRAEASQLKRALVEAEEARASDAELLARLDAERAETARLRGLIEEAAQAERNAATLTVELEKARVERDSYRQEASRLRALLAIANAGQNRQNAMHGEVDRLRADLAAATARAEEAVHDRKRLAEAKLELAKLREEVEMLEDQNSQLHSSMAEAAARVAEARRAANARMADLAALQHQIDELRQSNQGVAAAANAA